MTNEQLIEREQIKGGNYMLVDDTFKEYVLSNEEIKRRIGIYILYNFYKEESKDGEFKTFDLETYDFYNWYLYDKDDTQQLRDTINDIIKTSLTDDLVNNVYDLYKELEFNSDKQLIYTLSRLLYVQDKNKDNIVGQELDNMIKLYVSYIKNKDNDEPLSTENKTLEELEELNRKLTAHNLFYIIPSLNYDIYRYGKYERPFMSLWIKGINRADLVGYLGNFLNNVVEDSTRRIKTSDDINDYINKIINTRQFNEFLKANDDVLRDIIKEYKEINGNNDTTLRLLVSLKDKQNLDDLLDEEIKKQINDPLLNKIYDIYTDYQITSDYLKYQLTSEDIDNWQNKANNFINHLQEKKDATFNDFDLDYTLKHLAYSDYQLKEYKLNIDKEIKKDNKLLQATSKQLKAIDNARGGLVTYNETDTQALKNAIKEKQESLKNTHIKQDKAKLKQEIDKLNSDLVIAEQKEDELKAEYKNVCDYLENIYKSMANEPKTSSYYKDLKRAKKQQEQRKKEIERIIRFNGWQLDLWGNGSYELVLNKRQKERLKLTIENLSKQIAKYTKEEQDIFDFLISKYLHNTDIKEIKFTLREYEETKKRVRPTNYLMGDIQAIRLLFREVWTYYTTSDKSYTFNEEHLFTKLNIKGELESDLNNLNNANLDTEISLEPTETLQNLLQDHDNYLYISTSLEIMQLNNDNEYLAKRLLKYLNYLARVNKKSVLNISLDTIIEELQHYGLKKFNMLDRHKTYKTEIVDVIDKTLSILEGENHLNKRFIEVLDRQPFINYDNEYRGKSQETSINEWGKHKIKIKVFDLDDTKLLETKQKQSKKKHKATKK